MEAHLAPTQPTQVNKVTTLCKICSGPHDTQYCMKDPEQDFVEYASSLIDKAGDKWYTFKPEQNNLGSQVNRPDEGQKEEGNIGNTNFSLHPKPDPLAFIAIEQSEG
nr:MAK10-like protein [Tanacetum cinerariifolium]